MNKMSTVDKNCWRDEQTDEVGSLWLALSIRANDNGMDISRWQTNHTKFATTITYALHKGTRARQFRYQKDVIDYFQLDSREGTTKRCEAYKKLKELEAVLESEISKLS